MKIVFVESLSRWARGLTASDNRVVSGRKFTPIDERKKKVVRDQGQRWLLVEERCLVNTFDCRACLLPAGFDAVRGWENSGRPVVRFLLAPFVETRLVARH